MPADVFLTSAPECRDSRSARQQMLYKRMQLYWETSCRTETVRRQFVGIHVALGGGPLGVNCFPREAIASCASSVCFRFYGAFERLHNRSRLPVEAESNLAHGPLGERKNVAQGRTLLLSVYACKRDQRSRSICVASWRAPSMSLDRTCVVKATGMSVSSRARTLAALTSLDVPSSRNDSGQEPTIAN